MKKLTLQQPSNLDAFAAAESGSRHFMSRGRFVAGVLCSVAATYASSGGPTSAAGARTGPWCRELSKAARDQIIDFRLYLLDGNDDVFSLSDLRGKPIWLQFFASWCGTCNDEAADIVRIANKYGEAIHVVGIDVKESPEKARAFRDRHKIQFPIALDETGSVFHSLGFKTFPTHVFFDSIGLITCFSGDGLTPDQMDNEIAVALARMPPPGPPSPKPS